MLKYAWTLRRPRNRRMEQNELRVQMQLHPVTPSDLEIPGSGDPVACRQYEAVAWH